MKSGKVFDCRYNVLNVEKLFSWHHVVGQPDQHNDFDLW